MGWLIYIISNFNVQNSRSLCSMKIPHVSTITVICNCWFTSFSCCCFRLVIPVGPSLKRNTINKSEMRGENSIQVLLHISIHFHQYHSELGREYPAFRKFNALFIAVFLHAACMCTMKPLCRMQIVKGLGPL